MKKEKGSGRMGWALWLILVCLLLSSACILFVPIAYGHQALTMLCSSVFWGMMLVGYGVLWGVVNRRRRKTVRKQTKRRIGIFTFFRNTPARIADCILGASILLLVLSAWIAALQGIPQYILSFLMLFSFHMHCILNGENFTYITTDQ